MQISLDNNVVESPKNTKIVNAKKMSSNVIFQAQNQDNEKKEDYNASKIYDSLMTQLSYPNDSELRSKLDELKASKQLPDVIENMYDRYMACYSKAYGQICMKIEQAVRQNTETYVQAKNAGQNLPNISAKTEEVMSKLIPISQSVSKELQPLADEILAACVDYEKNFDKAKLEKHVKKFDKNLEKTNNKLPEINKKVSKINMDSKINIDETSENLDACSNTDINSMEFLA